MQISENINNSVIHNQNSLFKTHTFCLCANHGIRLRAIPTNFAFKQMQTIYFRIKDKTGHKTSPE